MRSFIEITGRLTRRARLPRLLLAAVLLAILAAHPLHAQEGEKLEEPYASWEATASRAEEALEKRDASISALEELRANLAADREEAFQITQGGSVKVRALQAQIDALGPLPASGEDEADPIAKRRSLLSLDLARANAPIQAARGAFKRADVLIGELDALIRAQTAHELLARSPSPLVPTHWLPAAEDVAAYAGRVSLEFRRAMEGPAEWARFRAALPGAGAVALVGLLLLLAVQPFAVRRLERARAGAESPWRRQTVSVLISLAYLVIPAIGAAIILAAIPILNATPPSAIALAAAAPMMAALVIVAHWLGQTVFAPGDASMRLLDVDDDDARRGAWRGAALGLLLAIEDGYEAVEQEYAFTAEGNAVIAAILVVIGAVLLWSLARVLLRARAQEAEDGDAATAGFLNVLARLMQLAAVLGVVFVSVGYVAMARQAMVPMINSVAALGVALCAYHVIIGLLDLITGHASAEEDDTGSLLPIVVVFGLVLALAPVLALIWGARQADIVEIWRLLITGVEFGDTRISLETAILLVAVFAIGLLATRWLQRLLRHTVLPRTRIDRGGQTALVTGVGYVGLILSALVAVSSAGLNLSSLAVVAGALSVGIGFGLQTIVSNFVSGIILLVERPIKEGDWIEVSGQAGFVRKISVRSTRIETFDHHDVIVPNSELIAGVVKNMTLSSMRGRLIIPVGVAYGSDLEETKRILLEAANAHPLVEKTPGPMALFRGLGDNSLNFELRCVLTDVGASVTAMSEMLLQIYVELGKAGIEIPFPQRDIHLRDIDRLVGAIEGRNGAAKEAPATPAVPELPGAAAGE